MSETEISLGWLEAQIHALKRADGGALFGLDPEPNVDPSDADKAEPAGAPITARQKKLLAQLVEVDKSKASFLIRAAVDRVKPQAAADER